MNSKLPLFIFLCLLIGTFSVQFNGQSFSDLSAQAQSAYKAKEYEKSVELYARAIQAGDQNSITFYNAACSFALAGKKEEAFNYLEQAIARGFLDIEHIKKDTDLNALHAETDWQRVIAQVETKLKEQQAAAIAKFKKQLVAAKARLKEEKKLAQSGGGSINVSGNRRSKDSQSIKVMVDPRIELLSIIFRLAGNTEFRQNRLQTYSGYIDARFEKFREHPAVQFARRMREERGISHDAVMSMAIHLTDVPGLKVRTALENSALEKRWQPAEARTFAELVKSFAKESGFQNFIRENQPFYQLAELRMQKLINEQVDQKWFSAFFGGRPQLRFNIVMGMLNGTWSYGPSFQAPQRVEELYAIMGMWSADQEGIPEFNVNGLSTVIHEFTHPFVNPTVEKHESIFRKAGEALYPKVAGRMERQGYMRWKTVIDESLVRASVARYILAHKGEKAAAQEVVRQMELGFLWTDDIFALLEDYEKARDRYPTFESFLPKIAAYFTDLPSRLNAKIEQFEARRPKVVSITPGNGAQGVDPNLTEIKIVFDRPMSSSFTVMLVGENAMEHFPETKKSSFDETRTVFTMQVKLKPNWTYEFGLNSETMIGFRSQEGIGLKPYLVKFQTGASSGN